MFILFSYENLLAASVSYYQWLITARHCRVQENSARLTNQRVSYAFTSSPFSFHARHILPTSKFQHTAYLFLSFTYFLQASVNSNCECKTVNTVHWFDASCSDIPVNNSITFISPVQSLAGLHFLPLIVICVAMLISEQFSPKARRPTNWMPSSDQILTQNDHSRSFKVIHFGVNEEPLRGYIVQYNSCGIECEGSEDIASERKSPCTTTPSDLTPPL